MKRVLFTKLLCLVVLLLPLTAGAGTLDFASIERDFKPVEGVLVMALDGEWLIDVDSKQGVSPGDLFSVVKKGRAVLHPTTNEILGHIEETTSLLRITKIKSGYSYAVIVKQDGELKPGMSVRRFAGLTARMLGASDEGRALYSNLQAAAPHLEWAAYETSDKAFDPSVDLTFRYDGSGLTVSASDNTPLRFYAVQQSVASSTQHTFSPTVVPGAASAGGIVVTQQSLVQHQTGGIVRTQQSTGQDGVWQSPPFRDVAVGMDVADLDGDGNMEIAVLTASSVGVARFVDGEYKQIAHYALPDVLKALSLDAADLDGNGRAELYLTAAREHEVNSSVLELAGKTLNEVASNLPYYFRNTHLAGEGRVLLGQRFGNYENPYNGPVFRVQRQGTEISQGPALSLPRNTDLYSFLSMDDGVVARLSDKSLAVASVSGVLWKGRSFNGASEVFVEYIDPDDRTRSDTLPFFVPPRLVSGDNGVVLATEHKETFLNHRFQTYDQGRVSAYQWDGTSMRQLWHTKPQAGHLADFNFIDADNDGDKEVIGYFTFGRQSLLDLSQGRSALLVFELN